MSPSLHIMGNEISFASDQEVKDEAEHLKAICFIIKEDETQLKIFLDELSFFACCGRDYYSTNLTAAYDLLVR